MKLVILAGGRGTRMGPLGDGLPKPLVPLAGKPILEHQIELAQRYGFDDVHLLTGYRGDMIAAHLGDGARWNMTFRYTRESSPLGTAGAVKAIAGELSEDFMVFYGDVMMDVDLDAMVAFHSAGGPLATIAVHPNDHPHDSDLVEAGVDARVKAIHPKPHAAGALHRNLVSAALYILSPRVLEHVAADECSDFGRDIFPAIVANGGDVRAYRTREYIKDVGTGTRLAEVETDVLSGRVSRLNRANPLSAVFLDRDGVINPDETPVRTPADMAVFPGVATALRALNRSERLAVVITNQPLVAKGMLTEPELELIHARLEWELSAGGAYVDAIYYCPHHPERGHPGERAEYKIDCACRKPGIGLIERATADLNIDLSESFIVGDRTVDIQTGINAGIATVLVRTGAAGLDRLHACDPDFAFDDAAAAVDFIVRRYDLLLAAAMELVRAIRSRATPKRVVLVGGKSRAGKSTFSAILGRAFRRSGVEARHLQLDHWIQSKELRGDGGGVRDRFRYDDIVSVVERLLSGERVEFERYDAIRRGASGVRQTMQLSGDEFLIVDGVPALDIPRLRDLAARSVYVEVDEDTRRRRFHDFYSAKGLGPDEAASLYARRERDESGVVEMSSAFAHTRIDLEAIQ